MFYVLAVRSPLTKTKSRAVHPPPEYAPDIISVVVSLVVSVSAIDCLERLVSAMTGHIIIVSGGTLNFTYTHVSEPLRQIYTVFQKKTSTHIIGYKLRNSCPILIIFDIKIPHII